MFFSRGISYKDNSMVNFMIVSKTFLTRYLIGWAYDYLSILGLKALCTGFQLIRIFLIWCHWSRDITTVIADTSKGIYFWLMQAPKFAEVTWVIIIKAQAPVPLSIFRSNSKFDENSERSSFKSIRPITTIFCTRHDSDTVVTCAKYRCDRPRTFYTRVFWIFIEFRIRSKYA